MAADQGHNDAQYRCGYCLEYGRGTTSNLGKALKYYKVAADQGHEKAQFYYGRHLENGRGIEKNLEEALKYYKMAADKGDANAREKCKELSEMK
jgi:hypothetical protein